MHVFKQAKSTIAYLSNSWASCYINYIFPCFGVFLHAISFVNARALLTVEILGLHCPTDCQESEGVDFLCVQLMRMIALVKPVTSAYLLQETMSKKCQNLLWLSVSAGSLKTSSDRTSLASSPLRPQPFPAIPTLVWLGTVSMTLTSATVWGTDISPLRQNVVNSHSPLNCGTDN